MKNTCLTSEEIITSFLNYLDNTIYSYAYMLDGSWGSGKTFFVKNMLIPAIEKREREKKISDLTYKEKKILYVSLYGIKDTEEISRLLYIELRHVTAEELTPDIPDKLQSHKGRISSWLATTGKILAALSSRPFQGFQSKHRMEGDPGSGRKDWSGNQAV